MNIKTLIASLGLAAGLCAVGTAFADSPIYKWVDDQGRVHYSTEPHGDKAQQLAIQNPSSSPSPTTATAPVNANQQYQSDAQLVQPQATDSQACKAGRDRLFKYLHADSLYSLDDKGNKVPLPDDQKKKALDEARAYATQACNGGGA